MHTTLASTGMTLLALSGTNTNDGNGHVGIPVLIGFLVVVALIGAVILFLRSKK